MAAMLVAVALMIALIPQVACTSPPTPDPDHGVSNASYRLCVDRAEKNMAGILKRLQAAEASDLANPKPVHTQAWWDAQISEVSATDDLLRATLQGSTYTASPQ